jgi:hypothetical protein
MDRTLPHDEPERGHDEVGKPISRPPGLAKRQDALPPAVPEPQPPLVQESVSVRGDRVHSPTRSRPIYAVSPDERQTMVDVGRFRTITTKDLIEWRYAGNGAKTQADLRSLVTQGLLQRKTVWTGRHREKETFWALTSSGKRLLKRDPVLPSGQAIYAGFVKPAELRHDAAIYPMYHREAQLIAKEGGRIKRVVLDFELKKKAYSPLAKAKALPPKEYAARQAQIAGEHGLKVVNGHLVLPDLRIEYETEDGSPERVDLELATASYHGSHAAEKVAAGLKMYAAPDTAERLTAALEEREITAEILHL